MTTTTQNLEHATTLSRTAIALAGLIGLGLATWTTNAAASHKAQVDGGLDREAVRTVVRTRINDIRDCYNTELIEDDSVGGRVVIDFTITAAGSVEGVAIGESTMPARFDGCVAAAVGTWQFPSADAATSVSYPFMMEPG